MPFFTFLDKRLKTNTGNARLRPGEWNEYDISTEPNPRLFPGFQAAENLVEAFRGCSGETLSEVWVRGPVRNSIGRFWSEICLVRAWKWKIENSVALAHHAAQAAWPIWEKVALVSGYWSGELGAVRQWLENPWRSAQYRGHASVFAISLRRMADSIISNLEREKEHFVARASRATVVSNIDRAAQSAMITTVKLFQAKQAVDAVSATIEFSEALKTDLDDRSNTLSHCSSAIIHAAKNPGVRKELEGRILVYCEKADRLA